MSKTVNPLLCSSTTSSEGISEISFSIHFHFGFLHLITLLVWREWKYRYSYSEVLHNLEAQAFLHRMQDFMSIAFDSLLITNK